MTFIDKIENKSRRSFEFLDYVRVFGSIVIITMHVMINFIKDFNVPPTIFNSIIYLSMFANYLFFISSGYSCMKYEKDISIRDTAKLVLKRYIGLVLFAIPFSFIEALWNAKLAFSFEMVKNAIVGGLLSSATWDHLWFMYTLLAVYVLLPFLIKIYKNSDNCLLFAFTILLFIMGLFKVRITISAPIYMLGRLPFNNVLLSVTLGAFLYRYDVMDKINTLIYAILIIVMTFIWFKMHFIVTMLSDLLYLTIFSVFVFVLFAKIFKKKSKLFSVLASHNYIIYLVHVFFIHMITKVVKINLYSSLGIFGLVITIVVVYILSFATSFVICKIPVIGNLYSKNKK